MTRRNGLFNNVLHDAAGNPVDVTFVAGVRRLAVDAIISGSEIQIGGVELDDAEGSTRAAIRQDATIFPVLPTDFGGLLLLGRDDAGAVLRHVRVNGLGQLIVAAAGGAPLNTTTLAAPTFFTAGVVSALAVAANAARRALVLTVTTAAARISLGFGAAPAVLDSGITVFTGQPITLNANLLSTQAVNIIANMAGVNVSVQEGS